MEWGERSRVEILVGRELKDEYDHTGRLLLEVCGEVAWPEYEEQGRLEIWYDEADGVFRASQSVTVSDDARNTPLADETAALDIGANTLVAATTTTGQQLLYEGRDLFERFRRQTEEIAEYQSLLDDQRRTSHRIDQLYRRRTRQRNHAQDALVRALVERLHDEGVSKVYVGDLEDVLEANWEYVVNEKTHNFWAFSRFVDRLECVCEEYGIKVVEEPEAMTTQMCPECGECEDTQRNGDVF